MNRRSVLVGILAATSLAVLPRSGSANTLPQLAVHRSPGCGCCEEWAQNMRAAGFDMTIEDDPNLDARRASLGIPAELASCHIALADGYAFEGHIPAADVLKFLHARPVGAIGLVVPGMPAGSPGMGPEGSGRPYDLLLLTVSAAPTVYATH
jgi:hypothetical protein